MKRAVCLLDASAAGARLVLPDSPSGADVLWRAEPPGEAENGIADARRRIDDAAAWCGEQRLPGRRLDVVCLAVDQALCGWLSAPSAEPQVVAAAVRRREQDWGAGAVGAAIQPLVEPAARERRSLRESIRAARRGGRPAAAKAMRFTVLRIEDGAARLWIDAMDRRSVRIGAVMTLWHAICRAWGDGAAGASDAPVTCAALVEQSGRVTWAWALGRRMLTGGVVEAPPAHARREDDPDKAEAKERDLSGECGRLTLDWLTWSANLGRRPDRLAIIGHHAEALAKKLGGVWPSTPCRVVDEDDPVGATLERVASGEDGAIDEDDPRSCLIDLSARPGRTHRRLYLWSAAAVLLLAGAAVGLGHQYQQWAGMADELAEQTQAQRSEGIAEVEPALAGDPFPLRALQSVLSRLQRENPNVAEPPAPRQILDELLRVSEQLQALSGSPGVELDRIQITNDQASVSVRVNDFGTGESLRGNLANSKGSIRWTGVIDGQPPNLTVRLTGVWEQQR